MNVEEMTGEELALEVYRLQVELNKRINGIAPTPTPTPKVVEAVVEQTARRGFEDVNCEYCDKQFTRRSTAKKLQRYCSLSCANSSRAQKRSSNLSECKNCGKDFTRVYSWQSHCGKDCRDEYYAKRSGKSVAPPLNTIGNAEPVLTEQQTTKCHICGDEFKRRRHANHTGWKMYCSRPCQDRASHTRQKLKEYNAISDAEKLELLELKKKRDKQKELFN